MKEDQEFEKRVSDAKILKALTVTFILVTYILVFLKVLFW
jgi:hypothetical protein